MALKNTNLNQAARAKKDEFYTQRSDIENELKHYKSHFRDKVVYCNCDDPTVSNFFFYFSNNFEHLGLRKLLTTCYKNQKRDLFSRHDYKHAIKLEYDGFREGDRVPRIEDIGVTHLHGDGDFRSEECVELLKEANIVVTNPPFSLFREYVAQLIKYDKKFIIIGNVNAISYKEIFPLIKQNKLWLGSSITSGNLKFGVPDHYPLTGSACGIDDEGQRFVRVKGIRWFTNLDHNNRYEDLNLYRKYTPEDYPHYDNYDAIEVSKTKDIPRDWDKAMGVPITFIDKYNPNQFEILGITDRDDNSGLKTKTYTVEDVPNPGDLNRRATIRVGSILKATYARILIRNRRPEL